MGTAKTKKTKTTTKTTKTKARTTRDKTRGKGRNKKNPPASGRRGAQKNKAKAAKPTAPIASLRLFVACAPGLEALLGERLAELTGVEVAAVPGGAELTCDVGAFYRVALGCGLGTHLSLRLGTFKARRFEALLRETAKLPLRAILGDEVRFEVKARCKKSRLNHTGAVAERVTTVLTQARGSGRKDKPVVVVQCRVFHDEVTLSVDVTGEPLYKRGYRVETSKAPLREDLALALVLQSGWDPTTPLVDPFCGSGTIAIEAARHALGLLPGASRPFLFEALPFFDRGRFTQERSALTAARGRPDATPVIRCADRDPGAVEAARNNAARGEVDHVVTVEQAPISTATVFEALTTRAGTGGAVVTNPPHGLRVGDPRTLKRLYQSLGQRLREVPDGCPVALLVRDTRTARAVGVPLETLLLTDQGGSKVRVLAGMTGGSR